MGEISPTSTESELKSSGIEGEEGQNTSGNKTQ
jgi:hypothetical protein